MSDTDANPLNKIEAQAEVSRDSGAMSNFVGKEHAFMTVDGFEVTQTHSECDSHGSQCTWMYFNGRMIDIAIARQLQTKYGCYPHKFEDAAPKSDHRFKCSVCSKKTSDFEEYSRHQGHYEGRYNYPQTNKVDLPGNEGRVFDSVAFVNVLSRPSGESH
jgi:hypothetical protein